MPVSDLVWRLSVTVPKWPSHLHDALDIATVAEVVGPGAMRECARYLCPRLLEIQHQSEAAFALLLDLSGSSISEYLEGSSGTAVWRSLLCLAVADCDGGRSATVAKMIPETSARGLLRVALSKALASGHVHAVQAIAAALPTSERCLDAGHAFHCDAAACLQALLELSDPGMAGLEALAIEAAKESAGQCLAVLMREVESRLLGEGLTGADRALRLQELAQKCWSKGILGRRHLALSFGTIRCLLAAGADPADLDGAGKPGIWSLVAVKTPPRPGSPTSFEAGNHENALLEARALRPIAAAGVDPMDLSLWCERIDPGPSSVALGELRGQCAREYRWRCRHKLVEWSWAAR